METSDKEFTKEEIEAANSVRLELQNKDVPDELKSVYMAGEINMAVEKNQQLGLLEIELRQKKTLLESCEKALEGREQQLKEKDKELFELKEEADKQLTFLRNRLSEDREQLAEKDKEIENLKSVMVAAAEEIKLHWMAHCDEEGYGPSNLLNRLEKGLASSYSGYKPGNIEKMEKEIAFLKEALSFSLQFIPRSTINVNRIAKIENLLK